MCANLKYCCTQCTKVKGKSDMVLRILSVLVIFPSRVEPKLSMPIMHMFGSDQSLFIGPGNPRTSPLSGDQEGPHKTQDPGPRRPDWWVGPEVALTVYCCEQLLSLFCRSRNKPLFTNSRTWYFGCAFLHLDGGSPMSHVDFKKWQCPLSLFVHFPCRF